MAHALKSKETYDLQIGVRGRVVLPARVRKKLGLREGDRMMLTVQPDRSLHLVSLQEQVKKLRGMYRRSAPGVSLADELVRDRREEARRENAN